MNHHYYDPQVVYATPLPYYRYHITSSFLVVTHFKFQATRMCTWTIKEPHLPYKTGLDAHTQDYIVVFPILNALLVSAINIAATSLRSEWKSFNN